MFSDPLGQWDCNITSNPDKTFDAGHIEDASLGDFFGRPVKVFSDVWNVGSAFSARFDPWTLFFTNKRVINRINNYNLLRCKLKLKFVINGSAFHYGRLLVSYLPLAFCDTVSDSRTGVAADLTEYSQRPHIFLDPTYSQGGSMTLPFFYYKNWINIPESKWDEMGVIFIDDFNYLKHANGADSSVTISVFAHAEDVIVTVPTTVDSTSLVNQTDDEYGKPIISRSATSVASAMGMLREVPVIGPYARATGMVANTVAAIASAFGYSRPNVITDPMQMRTATFGNVSNTDAPEISFKTSLDSKQELTIDSRTVGLSGQDEMTIASVATRPAFLASIPWAISNIAEDHLFSVRVSPILYTLYTDGGIHMTALCFAANPFKYWRGTLRYRFQIVCSSFHKGRLKFVYDPGTMAASVSEYNTVYTRIVDITEETDFTMEIGWGNEKSYLEVDNIVGFPTPYSLTILPLDRVHTNGTLSIFVVNELTTPSTLTNNDIYINIFVSGADNIEFAVPHDLAIKDLSYFSNQSGNDTMCDNCPDYSPTLDTIAEDVTSEATNHVFFGETIKSFRNCLKRYQFHSAVAFSTVQSTTDYYVKFTSQNFPIYVGITPTGVHDSVPTANIVHNTLLNYLTPAYVAMRGSIRYKVRTLTGTASAIDTYTVVRSNEEYVAWQTDLGVYQLPSTYTQAQFAAQHLRVYPSMWNAAVITASAGALPALEYELVHYDNNRFLGAKNITLEANEISPGKYCNEFITTIRGASAYDILNRFVSVGEDFSLFFFTGAPVAYAYSVL